MDPVEVLFWIALFGIDEVFVKYMKYTNYQLFMHYFLILTITICARKFNINFYKF